MRVKQNLYIKNAVTIQLYHLNECLDLAHALIALGVRCCVGEPGGHTVAPTSQLEVDQVENVRQSI